MSLMKRIEQSIINTVIDGEGLILEMIDDVYGKNNFTTSGFNNIMEDVGEFYDLLLDRSDLRDKQIINTCINYGLSLMVDELLSNERDEDEFRRKAYDEDLDLVDDYENALEKCLRLIEDLSSDRRGRRRGRRDDDYDDRRGRGSDRRRRGYRNRNDDRDDRRDRDDRGSRRSRRRERDDEREERGNRRNNRSRSRDTDRRSGGGSDLMSAINERQEIESNNTPPKTKPAYEFVDPQSVRETQKENRSNDIYKRRDEQGRTQAEIIENYPIDVYPYRGQIHLPAYDPSILEINWYVTEDNTRRCNFIKREIDPMNPEKHIFIPTSPLGHHVEGAPSEPGRPYDILDTSNVVDPDRIRKSHELEMKKYEKEKLQYEEDIKVEGADVDALVKPEKPEISLVKGKMFDLQKEVMLGFGHQHIHRNMLLKNVMQEDVLGKPMVGLFTISNQSLMCLTKDAAERQSILDVLEPLIHIPRENVYASIMESLTNARAVLNPSAFVVLDRALTRVVNEVIGMCLNLPNEIDSFYNDFVEMNANIKERYGMTPLELWDENSLSIVNAFSMIVEDNTPFSNDRTACERAIMIEERSYCVSVRSRIEDLQVDGVEDDTILVDETSHPKLYQMVKELRELMHGTTKRRSYKFYIYFEDGYGLEVFDNFAAKDALYPMRVFSSN